MTDNVSTLPVTGVDIDLDSAERDPSTVKPIFVANVGGRKVEMGDPEDVDWQDLMYLDNPVELLKFVVSDEDLRHIRAQQMPAWKLGKLMEAYSEHYDFAGRMKRAQRDAQFAGAKV